MIKAPTARPTPEPTQVPTVAPTEQSMHFKKGPFVEGVLKEQSGTEYAFQQQQSRTVFWRRHNFERTHACMMVLKKLLVLGGSTAIQMVNHELERVEVIITPPREALCPGISVSQSVRAQEGRRFASIVGDARSTTWASCKC